MKTKIISVALLMFFTVNINFGQQDVKLAEKAKEIFPEEKVVLPKSTATYEFSFGKSTGAVVKEELRESFISLEKNQEFVYPVFYSGESKLTNFKSGKGGYDYVDENYNVNGIFHDDIKVSYTHYKIIPYAAKTYFQSDLIYNDLKYITDVYFNNYFSALTRIITFIIPDDFNIDLVPINFEGHHIQVDENHRGKTRIVTYTMNNVDKFSTDDDLPGRSYIYPHILIHVKGYSVKGNYHKVFQTTDDLYNWYKKLTNSIGNNTEVLKPLVNQLIAGKKTDKEKIESIFYWVQDNIRYIAFENGIAGYKPASCQEVYKKRYGDCKGMANLTKEMLKLAGFDARLGWLGTRIIAYDYSVPSLAVDNHMICVLPQQNNYLYLDATEKFSRLGEYAERIQNKTIMIENGDHYILQKIPSVPCSQNLEKYTLELSMDQGQILKGSFKVVLSGESKVEMMNYLSSVAAKNREELLEKFLSLNNNHISIKNINAPEPNRDPEYEFSGDMVIPDHVSHYDNEYYIYLDPLKIMSDDQTDKDRKYALWFDYKKCVEVDIVFNLPKGYTVSSTPDPLQIEKDEYTFNVNYNVKGNQILYSFRSTVPRAEISDSSLSDWNKSIKMLNNTYEQPVILKDQ